jgi:antitoxin MazE
MPKAVACSAHFAVGQSVEVMVQDAGVVVKAIGEPKLPLAQKLVKFDIANTGEVMAPGRVGAAVS